MAKTGSESVDSGQLSGGIWRVDQDFNVEGSQGA